MPYTEYAGAQKVRSQLFEFLRPTHVPEIQGDPLDPGMKLTYVRVFPLQSPVLLCNKQYAHTEIYNLE